jgi:simple sugar transport system permease protein
MASSWTKLLTRNESLLVITIITLSLVVGLANPAYFSVENAFRIIRSMIVTGIFAVGVLMVLISGGIDVSFTAIGVFAMYTTMKLMVESGYSGSIIPMFALSGLIGGLLGCINGVFIAFFSLPTLIVTLGTLNLFRGFLLFFIGTAHISNVPASVIEFSRSSIFSVRGVSGGLVHLHTSVLILGFCLALVWFILNRTMLGRGIYALGGNPEAARRAGFDTRRIQFFIYCFVGVLAGIAGLISGSLVRQAVAFSIVGSELDVIAAVVLGGASISGGRGTVIGTLLGVMLITIVNNVLVLMGIPSVWQKAFIGVMIIIGTAVPAIQSRRLARGGQSS